MLCHVLCFPFVSVCTRTHCPFIVPKSSETKDHAEFQIVVQFWNIYFLHHRLKLWSNFATFFFFYIEPNLIALRTFLQSNHGK